MEIELINRTIEVDFVPKIKDNEDCMGKYHPKESFIEILDDLPEDITQQVLLHEIIHACENNSGIDELNESQVDMLATELLYFIKHNKKMIKVLMDECCDENEL